MFPPLAAGAALKSLWTPEWNARETVNTGRKPVIS
jgi:hypothetical protein